MANEIATQNETFVLKTLDGELAEAVAEEMDGLGTIPYDRVKIPAGGGLAFELPGETEEDAVSVTELVGVILYHHPVNAYWADSYAGGNEQPDCGSSDGKQGINRSTGVVRDCAECPHNQFGTDGSGKACKNVHRIYMLREDNPIPLVLSLPPTSIKYMREYIGKRVLLKGYRCFQVITKITLKKEKSRDGITYSRAAFALAGVLDAEQAAATGKMAQTLKEQNEGTVSSEDYAAAPQEAADGFVVADAIAEGELPFN